MKKSARKFVGDSTKYYPLLFTVIFVVILFQYSFSFVESRLYDLRIKYDFGIGFRDNIVIVVMDEESDEFLGEQYPYTFASHSKLLKRIVEDRPVVVNYLVNFQGAIAEDDRRNLISFKTSVKKFVEDGRSFRFGTDLDEWGERLPPPFLRDLGYSLAILNVDGSIFAKDNIARRALLNIDGEDTLHLWAANKYRFFQNKKVLNINSILGAYYLPAASASFTLFKYYTSPLKEDLKIKKIPFHRVVVGNFPKGYFTDKIVLVGPRYISRPREDYVLTPFDDEMSRSSKLAVHANIIQSLIQNKTIYKVPELVSQILAIIIAVFLSVIVFKYQPVKGLMITFGLIFGIILFSYLHFSIMGLWLQTGHLILTVLVVYYIWVPFKAIGEYKRRYAIQEESKLLKRVENLKRNFISLMSHDLKTPVAKIAGIADVTLQQHRSNPDIAKNLQSIIDSTRELNKFITSILDLTKVESQELNLQMVSKDINPIIENIVEKLRYEATNKNIEIILELGPIYPIELDINLINRVISNLVENAIKYSGDNSIINIKTWDDEQWIFVEIKDNGVGISQEDLEYIFEKFYRVKNDTSHRVKGTGLGLYLVKYFVELHGGSITAESIINEGTIFQIKLKNA